MTNEILDRRSLCFSVKCGLRLSDMWGLGALAIIGGVCGVWSTTRRKLAQLGEARWQ